MSDDVDTVFGVFFGIGVACLAAFVVVPLAYGLWLLLT